MPWLEPLTLQGRHGQLVPLQPGHAPALAEAVQDGRLWERWFTLVPEPQAMAAEVERRLALQAAGQWLPFAVLDAAGQPVGMTSYLHADATHRRVEIGSTWYAARVQRTGLNTEAKHLLLQHAFEALGCIAVEFRTHVLNQASRRAIERLGARLDGILRSHMIMPNGTLRDTCVYSITAHDWPTIRAHLQWLMDLPRQPR